MQLCSLLTAWQTNISGETVYKERKLPFGTFSLAPSRRKELHPYSAHSTSCCFVLYLVLFKVQQHIYFLKFSKIPNHSIRDRILNKSSRSQNIKSWATSEHSSQWLRHVPFLSGPAGCPGAGPSAPTLTRRRHWPQQPAASHSQHLGLCSSHPCVHVSLITSPPSSDSSIQFQPCMLFHPIPLLRMFPLALPTPTPTQVPHTHLDESSQTFDGWVNHHLLQKESSPTSSHPPPGHRFLLCAGESVLESVLSLFWLCDFLSPFTPWMPRSWIEATLVSTHLQPTHQWILNEWCWINERFERKERRTIGIKKNRELV